VTRLLVVDDHEIVRAGLKQLLADDKEFTVAGEAGTGAAAVNMVRESDWDVVLLDISMPDMNGIDTLKQIKHWNAKVPVLILTVHTEENYAINLLRAGASGFINKMCTSEDLVDAIRIVASGKRYLSTALRQKLAAELNGGGNNALHTWLSQREFQIFCKLANGQGISEIANELFLSVKTVSVYRARLLEKMGMKTNAQITYYAIKHGLIQ
jgi:DNA-binding NarL/FixJ family response regulator